MTKDEVVILMARALQMSKPIVGSAVASATNEARPVRQKVYDKMSEALDLYKKVWNV